MPSTKTMGKNTAIVVNVEATTALPTSPVPRTVAAIKSSPSSRQRKMLSNTTIELSTNMPTPSANPPNDMMLSDTPRRFRGAKVTKMEIGMLIALMVFMQSGQWIIVEVIGITSTTIQQGQLEELEEDWIVVEVVGT